MPICPTCGGYYLRPPCPVCSPKVDESKAKDSIPKNSSTLTEYSLDTQLKSGINRAKKEKEELESKIHSEKGEFETKIKEISDKIQLISSKVDELKIELENKNKDLETGKTNLLKLEESHDISKRTLLELQNTSKKINLDISDKENVLNSLREELGHYTK